MSASPGRSGSARARERSHWPDQRSARCIILQRSHGDFDARSHCPRNRRIQFQASHAYSERPSSIVHSV
ncbi:hypothetical protein LMH87_004010 [Akanthomyces muscarius]|uniref:Uncharacterized protein n=1 Tax=Akanthomyces muscarius TaxID=2231603 RepID=A0A9W8UF81_AKAMU|nr:hypothetical protein LMH87_004010 [Akanthomyces muscarius]KAJ4145152.1 hypothetical protein LMH87_004010 [Akanthomyces muscarius]